MLRTHWDDLVDEEDVEDIEPAKYWDEANGEIVEGLQARLDSDSFEPLEALSGSYRWVYEIQPPQYTSPVEYWGKELEKAGFMTLSFPNEGKAALETLSGTLKIHENHGQFVGVTAAKDRLLGDEVWGIPVTKWEEERVSSEEGNCLGLSAVDDDDGHPFLIFKYVAEGGGFQGLDSVTFLAKKQRNSTAVKGLSDGEKERLGMGVDPADVQARAEDVDDEEEEGEEEEEEEAAPVAVNGRKRKVEEDGQVEENPGRRTRQKK